MKSGFLSTLFEEGKAVDKAVTAIQNFIVIFAGASSLFLLLTNIITRYFFGIGIHWAEEYSRYCFVLIIYFGVPLTVKADQMLRVDILANIFPKLKNFEEWVEIVSGLVVAVICFVLGYQFTGMMHMFGERSPVIISLPMWIVYAIMPAGMVFLFYAYAQRGYKLFMAEKAGKEGNA
ncbi:MAG: TRAP transporter small permease [Ruminococcaceae bacterium]|nr:TRAP transporter small permease [Oscillospiraceae bacterium]